MQQDFYWFVLNAIPIPVFVMDEQVRVREVNQAALSFFGLNRASVLKQSGGEALQCINSAAGCGPHAACNDCVIRQSVNACRGGSHITRRRMKFTMAQQGKNRELELLITTSPVPGTNEVLTLLVIEDITQLSMLKSLLPICMHCKKIRDDGQFWHYVEDYFHSYIGVDFSHGVCPDCVDRIYRRASDQV